MHNQDTIPNSRFDFNTKYTSTSTIQLHTNKINCRVGNQKNHNSIKLRIFQFIFPSIKIFFQIIINLKS